MLISHFRLNIQVLILQQHGKKCYQINENELLWHALEWFRCMEFQGIYIFLLLFFINWIGVLCVLLLIFLTEMVSRMVLSMFSQFLKKTYAFWSWKCTCKKIKL